jgi:hypothetical protein
MVVSGLQNGVRNPDSALSIFAERAAVSDAAMR